MKGKFLLFSAKFLTYDLGGKRSSFLLSVGNKICNLRQMNTTHMHKHKSHTIYSLTVFSFDP